VKELLSRFPIGMVVPDASGVGDNPVQTMALEMPEVTIFKHITGNRIGFIFSAQSKMALVETMAGEFAGHTIHLPMHDGRQIPRSSIDPQWESYRLEGELTSLRFEIPENTKRSMVTAIYPKPREGDDRFYAFAMAVYGLRQRYKRSLQVAKHDESKPVLVMPSIGAKTGQKRGWLRMSSNSKGRHNLPTIGAKKKRRARGHDRERYRDGRPRGSWR
jgi:hypothetical protein